MKIAVVGSGISGLTSAYLLSRKHEVHLFEAADYIGGHTHTVDVETPSGRHAIDTGFIVFNDWTYPNFIRLLSRLGVESQPTAMSFSVKAEGRDFEYTGTKFNGLFAQRLNLVRPSFIRMIRDILRFNRESLETLDRPDEGETLGRYLARHEYGREFKEHYIIPMGAAIWSASSRQMEDFPVQYFVRFFKNHGLLSVDERPQWRVVRSGSRSYLPAITNPFAERIHLRSPVRAIERERNGVLLVVEGMDGRQQIRFDEVILSCHSDQAVRILGQGASAEERQILSAFAYQPNSTVLHTDTRVLPRRGRAWAAWNYWIPSNARDKVAVTYDMNLLQGLKTPETFCVSLNLDEKIDPARVLARFVYDHPVYTAAAVVAQARWHEISGVNHTHFAGAYWGFGFHEDGVKSGVRIAQRFGEEL